MVLPGVGTQAIQSLGILSRWCQSMQALGPHFQVQQDGWDNSQALIPYLEHFNQQAIANDVRQSGATRLLQFSHHSGLRRTLFKDIEALLPAQLKLDLQNEAVQLNSSLGDSRPLSMAAIGALNLTRPEEYRSILNQLYPMGLGLGLLLDRPPCSDESGHQIWFSGHYESDHTREILHTGFEPLFEDQADAIGPLIVLGAHPEATSSQTQAEDRHGNNAVDILIVSTLMALEDSWLHQTLERIQPRVALVGAARTAETLYQGIRLIGVGPVNTNYVRIDVQDQGARLDITQTPFPGSDHSI